MNDEPVKLTGHTPPVPDDTHTSCNIFLFGDLTISFEQNLRQLLHVKDNPTLHAFLERSGFALRAEISKLPTHQQEWFPSFTTLVDLVSSFKGHEGTPSLNFALLCLCELAQFFKYYGEGSRTFPNAANSYLIGLCTGSFAAAAISTSRTLSELAPAGIEAFLVAFRTSLRSLEIRNEIEKPTQGPSQSWSLVASIQEDQAKKIIDDFASTKGLPPSSRPYVSAVTPTNVTISGSPTILKEFTTASSLKTYHLPIDSPFHAPGLFKQCDIDDVLGQFHDNCLTDYSSRFTVLSAATGRAVDSTSFEHLLRQTVRDTLFEQVRLDKILDSLPEECFQYTKFKECTICPLSSNAAQLVASSLTRNSKISARIDDNLNASASTRYSAQPTGKFEHSKIAIIGYSGRYPEAESNEEFWELLRAGRDVHREIPKNRFNWETHCDPTGKKKNTSKVKYGCFIKEPGLFDSRFFNMSPRECENTDPAQRLAITSTYEAMEMAGLVPGRTPSTQTDRIGVFIGTTSDDWREINSGQNVDTYFIPGGNRAFFAGRISFFFRFSGPSLSIDTACSSSFASIQTACSYLWRGDCDTTIAGGTNVLTNPDNFAGLDRGHFLSTTGNCNTFDDGASGYCRSDAVGTCILKRLEDAQADNDPIFGVIDGAYTNHCGSTDSITRPFDGDQIAIFNRILRYSNQNPLNVSYVEMHGTGTQAGDATEMRSVLSSFVPGRERMPNYPLHVGSSKANIGHAESASGISSLVKVMMMMKNNEIPPHCGIKTKINHNYPLDLNDRNVHIAFKPTTWHREEHISGKRTAFLNNFSAAGGNTAVLLEDAPVAEVSQDQDPRSTHLVALSAKTANSLKANIQALIGYLTAKADVSLPQLSYTTTARRMQHNYRTIVSGSSIDSIRSSLQKKMESHDGKPVPNATKIPNIAFAFTGQGSLYAGVGKQLFESVAQFKANILRFDSIAQSQGFSSFLPIVNGSATNVDEVEPAMAHLALTCVQMALARLWMSWGIHPSAAIGHSLGEYAAMNVAGVLTPSDAIYLVGKRAQLLSERCTKGTHAMLAVKAPLDAIEPRISRSSSEVACMNQPTGTVISGPSEEIGHWQNELHSPNQNCVKLDIPFAFHSAQIDPILDDFEKAASGVKFATPKIPFMSPLLGKVVTEAEDLGPSYISRACRNPVNFQGALQSALESDSVTDKTIWIEIGSHPACSGMIKGTLGSHVTALPSLRSGVDTWNVLTNGLETLYLNGIDIQWNEYHRQFKSAHKVLELPRYSWELKNYWIMYKNDFCLTKGDDPLPQQTNTASIEAKPAGTRLSHTVQSIVEERNQPDVSSLTIETDINDPQLTPVIQGHKVNGAALCPSSLYADMALTMADYMLKANGMEVDGTGLDAGNMVVDRPLISNPKNGKQLLRVSASANWESNLITYSFFSVNAQGRKVASHASCKVHITPGQTWIQDWKRGSYLIRSRIASLQDGVDDGETHKMKSGIVYKLFGALVDYGPEYRGMREVVLDTDNLEATAQVSFQADGEGYFFNPCWIDSLGHLAGFIMNGNDNTQSKDQVFVNHGWDKMRVSQKLSKGKTYQTYNRMQLVEGTLYAGDTYILEGDTVVAVFEGVKFQGVPRRVLDNLLPSKSSPAGNAPKPSPGASQPPPSKAPAPTPKAKPSTSSKPKSTTSGPTNATLAKVMTIVCEEVGADASELQDSTEFADFGVDSLLSLNISGRLQEELSITAPSSLFSDCPTVKELKGFLGAGQGQAASSSSGSDSEAVATPELDSDSDASSAGYETGETSVSEGENPQNVMNVIRKTIAEEVGVADNELTTITSFAELGVDSLLGLNVMGTLAETLDLELPQTLFADNDSLQDIEDSLGLKPKPKSGKSRPATAPQAPALDTKSQGPAEDDSPPRATSMLLQGNPKTASKTLFLFPDGSGSATSYSSLPKVSSDVAIFGINCPWMKTPQDMKCTYEQLSAKYLAEIRRRQPKGPYYFGGWSAGGISAYDTAQQLTRNGEEVKGLILIDSPNPVGLENPPQKMYDFFDSLDFFGMEGKQPPSWLRPHFDAFLTCLDNYKVEPFVGRQSGKALPTHIIYAKDGICKNPDDPRPEIKDDDPREMIWLLNNRTDFSGKGGWADLVGEENFHAEALEDVNHFSLVAPGPKIEKLSAFIKRAMDA